MAFTTTKLFIAHQAFQNYQRASKINQASTYHQTNT
jgi:hypothetical protein